MEEIREKVIYLVETTKKIVETIMSDISNEKKFEDLFQKEVLKFEVLNKQYRNYNLDLFDNAKDYYDDLVGYFNFHVKAFYENEKTNIIKIESSFATIYFSILTDLLLDILKKDKESYLEDIIKFDVTIICEIIAGKDKRLINSNSFF